MSVLSPLVRGNVRRPTRSNVIHPGVDTPLGVARTFKGDADSDKESPIF